MSKYSESSSFAIYCMVKAPLHELEWFANYHLSIGAEKVYLYFDDPNDIAFDAFNDSRIVCNKCDEVEFRKEKRGTPEYGPKRITANIRHAMAECVKLGIAWLAIIDQDELIYSTNGLRKQIEQQAGNTHLLRLEVWEAIALRESYNLFFYDVNHFKRQPLPISFTRNGSLEIFLQWIHFIMMLLIARLFFVQNASPATFINGHRSGKVIIRTDLNFEKATAHGPVHASKLGFTTCRLRGSCLLHFDSCGYEQWKEKFNRLGTVFLTHTRLSRHRRKYVAKFLRARDAGEESLKEFYHKSKGYPPYQLRIMTLLGLVKKLSLVEQQFTDNKTAKFSL